MDPSMIPQTTSYESAAQGILALFVCIITAVTLARGVSRHIQGIKNYVEDYLSYAAWAFILAHIVACMLATSRGAMHTTKLIMAPPADLILIQRAFMALGVFFNLGMITVKLSVLFLFRRLFTMQKSWFTTAWWANFILIFPVWTTAAFALLGILFSKNTLLNDPIASYGIPSISIVTAVSDLGLLALPVLCISQLHMAKRQRVAIVGIFMLGLLTTCVSISRAAIALYNVGVQRDPGYSQFVDVLLGAAELTAALLCSSLPVVKPFLIKTNELLQRSVSALSSLVSSRPSTYRSSRGDSVPSSTASFENHKSGGRAQIMRTDSVEIEVTPLRKDGVRDLSSRF